MDFKDLRVFLIAIFALILVAMRTDARTESLRTRLASLDNSEIPPSSNSSTLYIYDTLNPPSSHDDDPLTPRLTLSTDTDGSLHGDNSGGYSRNDYRTEIDEEHPSTPKESEKKRRQHCKNKGANRQRDGGGDELQQRGTDYDKVDYDAATEDCDCRSGEGEQYVAPGETSPADKGALDARPTVYSGGNEDGPEGAGPYSSTATSMSVSSSAGLVACILLFFTF